MGRKVQIPGPDGTLRDAVDVGIDESSEKWSEFKLDDGTILRAKMSIVSAARVDNDWDQDGNPSYVIKSHNIVTVVESPEKLRRKVN